MSAFCAKRTWFVVAFGGLNTMHFLATYKHQMSLLESRTVESAELKLVYCLTPYSQGILYGTPNELKRIKLNLDFD